MHLFYVLPGSNAFPGSHCNSSAASTAAGPEGPKFSPVIIDGCIQLRLKKTNKCSKQHKYKFNDMGETFLHSASG